jgi:exopolysaccharide biosynthesis polyprenyl glycosylphosphotransferase
MVSSKERLFSQLTLAADIVALAASYFAAYAVRANLLCTTLGLLPPLAEYGWVFSLILIFWPLSLWRFRIYQSRTCHSVRRLTRQLIKAQLLAGLALLAAAFVLDARQVSRTFLEIFVSVSFVGLEIEKLGVRFALQIRASLLRARKAWRVLVVGRNGYAAAYFRSLTEHLYSGVEVVDVFDPESNRSANGNGSSYPRRPPMQLDEWRHLLKRHVVDEVVAVAPWDRAPELRNLEDACAERGIIFRMMLRMPEPKVGRYQVEDMGHGYYAVSLETIPQDYIALYLKRAIDIVGALLGLIACAIVYLFYALVLKLESPGPVIFRQQRIGQNGRVFTLFKFRTMCPDAEQRLHDLLGRNEMKGPLFKLRNDPRVTRVGRLMRNTHLDELPQFWNVLRGDMSLVGPRPAAIRELPEFKSHEIRRMSVKPGLTGVWQVLGNGTVNDFEEIVRLDCEYIDNWSLWLDTKILAKTVFTVLAAAAW